MDVPPSVVFSRQGLKLEIGDCQQVWRLLAGLMSRAGLGPYRLAKPERTLRVSQRHRNTPKLATFHIGRQKLTWRRSFLKHQSPGTPKSYFFLLTEYFDHCSS